MGIAHTGTDRIGGDDPDSGNSTQALGCFIITGRLRTFTPWTAKTFLARSMPTVIIVMTFPFWGF
jgi:hypothetical protein